MWIYKKILNHRWFNLRFGKKVVHVEAIFFTFDKLKRFLEKYKSKCYCLCPINYEYANSFFGVNATPEEYAKILKKNYLLLKNMGINLQLHVHISTMPALVSYEEKKRMINSAYGFFVKELKIVPTELVLGWYACDKEIEQIAQELGLIIRPDHFHTYDWWLN